MSNFPIQQFRLISGEEILCEIVEWGDDKKEILIRNVMAVETTIFDNNNERFYMFRPWLLYIENDNEIVIFNTDTVIGNATPNELLSMQYLEAVRDMKKISEERYDDYKKREAMKLKSLLENIAEKRSQKKELPKNVIKFPKSPPIIH